MKFGWLNAAACLLCSACAGDSGQSLDPRAPDAPGAIAGVHVRFDPGQGAALPFGAVPWPDDLYLDKQSKIDLPLSGQETDYVRRLHEALPELDGFGVTTPIYFYLDGELDPKSLPQSADDSLKPDASVFLIDADTGSPEAFQRVRTELQWSASEKRLAMRPALGHPLTPGRRYAALVTRRVKDTRAQALQPSEKFAAVRDSSVQLTDARLVQARAQYTPVLATLAKTTPTYDVVGMAVFRVQTANPDLEAARRWVRSRAKPQPTGLTAIDRAGLDNAFGDVSTTPTAAAHDQLLGVIHGSLSSPSFVSASDRYHGAWERSETGILQLKRNEDVPFTLFLPKGDAQAPVVIYQHQRGHERSDAVYVANALARHNIAVIAMDAPFQGLRARSDTSRVPDTKNRFTGAMGADRFGDEPGDFYGEQDNQAPLVPFHPFYARDALRQGVVDLMNLMRYLDEADLSALQDLGELGKRPLDLRRIGFIGEDIGAQMGVMLAPFEPRLQAVALVGAGAFVAQSFGLDAGNQASFASLVELLGRDANAIDFDADPPAFWPEFALFETLLGRGEPLAFAPTLRRSPVNVVLTMAADDETVANVATEALSVALGASVLSQDASYVRDLAKSEANAGEVISGNYAIDDDHVTRLLRVYAPADHQMLLADRGSHAFEAPVEPPFQARDQPDAFDNPRAGALADLGDYFASFFDCVSTSGAAATNIKCDAAITAP